MMIQKVQKRKADKCVKSYAKINLFLDVFTRRSDGFHNIRTIFSEIELADEIKYTLTNEPSIKILTNNDNLVEKDNLIYKIAFFIKDTYSVKQGLRVELEKKIPISAGLGGGSTNAAATIYAVNELWELKLRMPEMHAIARQFGSDINFFLAGGTAMGTARGEVITPLADIVMDNILLVNPGFGISSGSAYQMVKLSAENKKYEQLVATHDSKYVFNKLEEQIKIVYPAIDEIIKSCLSRGASNSILSGSGATVIGFFPDKARAQAAREYFIKQGYWSIISKTRRRHDEHN